MSNPQLTQALAEWVFKPIAEQFKECPASERMTGFAALRGSKDQGELMVVGRAVNGWEKGRHPKTLLEPSERKCWAHGLTTKWDMSWVIEQWQTRKPREYNTATSAFWRVIRRVTQQLVQNASESDWSSHLVWSNLYKVSPSTGGNPTSAMMQVQRPGCRNLLKLELEVFRPKRVLFLTGWDWAEEIIDVPARAHQPVGARFVERVWNEPVSSEFEAPVSRFVVACQPQGKGDALWTDEVLAAFGS